MNDEVKRTVHLFFYLTDEGGNVLNLGKNVLDLKESSVLASGSRADVGNWQMHLRSEVTFDLQCFLLISRIFSCSINITAALSFEGSY